jgi:hypothetical protein
LLVLRSLGKRLSGGEFEQVTDVQNGWLATAPVPSDRRRLAVGVIGTRSRSRGLEQDLILTPDDGAVKITQDELGNTYDRVGGPCRDYKP